VNTWDWRQLQATYQLNTFYPADLKWRGLTVRNVAIRSRGFGSRSQTKPGLQVDFDRYTPGQRFLGLKSLVLDNLWQDPSGIHETISMKLYRRMGLPAPREAHAALYLNNEFFGLYAVVEAIDEISVQRMLGESSGYLFEYHWKYEYRFEYLGPSLSRYAELFEPRTREGESEADLYAPIEAMTRAMVEAPDEDFVSQVSRYFDLQGFIRHAAVQNFIAQFDGILGYAGINNFYLYRYEGTSFSRLLPWDEDTALFLLEWPIQAYQDQYALMQRVMAVPELRDLYYTTLLDAVAVAAEVEDSAAESSDGQPAPGWFEREITREALLIRDTLLADRRKPFSNVETARAWNDALRFARNRGAYVACAVSKTLDPRHAQDDCAPPPDDGSVVLPGRHLTRDRAAARGARSNKQGPAPCHPGRLCTPVPDDSGLAEPGRISAPGTPRAPRTPGTRGTQGSGLTAQRPASSLDARRH
jgi:hypothetical protein